MLSGMFILERGTENIGMFYRKRLISVGVPFLGYGLKQLCGKIPRAALIGLVVLGLAIDVAADTALSWWVPQSPHKSPAMVCICAGIFLLAEFYGGKYEVYHYGTKYYKEFLDTKLEQEKVVSLRYLRKANPEAYAYVVKTDKLLSVLQK